MVIIAYVVGEDGDASFIVFKDFLLTTMQVVVVVTIPVQLIEHLAVAIVIIDVMETALIIIEVLEIVLTGTTQNREMAALVVCVASISLLAQGKNSDHVVRILHVSLEIGGS